MKTLGKLKLKKVKLLEDHEMKLIIGGRYGDPCGGAGSFEFECQWSAPTIEPQQASVCAVNVSEAEDLLRAEIEKQISGYGVISVICAS